MVSIPRKGNGEEASSITCLSLFGLTRDANRARREFIESIPVITSFRG